MPVSRGGWAWIKTQDPEVVAQYKKNHRKWLKDHRDRKLDILKQGKSCTLCSEDFPECLDFHHKDPSTKSFTIASGLNKPLAEIMAEVAKCDILCANCHRRRHAMERDGIVF